MLTDSEDRALSKGVLSLVLFSSWEKLKRQEASQHMSQLCTFLLELDKEKKKNREEERERKDQLQYDSCSVPCWFSSNLTCKCVSYKCKPGNRMLIRCRRVCSPACQSSPGSVSYFRVCIGMHLLHVCCMWIEVMLCKTYSVKLDLFNTVSVRLQS